MKIFKNMTSGRVIAIGFFAVIILGTLLLMLPISAKSGESTDFIDCLFTAASATCITGLATLITCSHWTLFGQIIILVMIQVGGIGFMAFVTLALMILGRRITLKNRLIIKESYNIDERKGIVKFILYICKFTFITEAMGAILLSLRFIPEFGAAKGIYYSVFHSVSAFCNAGFDLLGDNSLVNYSGDYLVCITIMALIIIGGIGFPVVIDLYVFFNNFFIKKYKLTKSFKLLKLNSKLAIVTTAILIFGGALFFVLYEYNNPKTLMYMSLPHKILAAFFQSVTLRTAGFASINQCDLGFGSKFMSILLMFVGGSPGSAAGGAKTVTMAVIILSVITMLRGSDSVTAFKRTITFKTIRKALSVVILMIFIAFAAIMILSVTEDATGMDIFYEVFSAIDTVGVTAGLTPNLTNIGKIVIIMCMFIGRIGPITTAMLLTSNEKKADIHYPEGKILVG